jgi:hypothetical protein
VSRTPDRCPGTREDEGVVLEPGAVSPTANGEIRYVTGSGFRFFEEGGEVGLSGSGITTSDHEELRQLIHFIDNGPANGFASGAYRENTGTVFPSAIIWWTSAAKTHKIVEKLLTYTGAFATTIQWKVYDTDGSTVLATVTDVVSYTGAFETSRTRTIA